MDTTTLTLMYLAIAVLVFIVCREFTCWYFKMSEIVDILKDIRDGRRKGRE